VEYLTYTFAPVELGRWRLQQFNEKGGRLEQRGLNPNEIVLVLSGTPLPGSDYTIVTMGLDARDLRTDFGLYPTRGILVHFPPIPDITSYRYPKRMRFIYSRSDAMVVGGTYEEHVGTLALGEDIAIGEELVRDANEIFGSDLRFQDRTKITVGFRPTATNPVFEFGQSVGFVNGLDGQGWVTGPLLGPYVVNEVCQKLGID
jgi:glycine/D-amino acid oxidase-like deaminating enzyme